MPATERLAAHSPLEVALNAQLELEKWSIEAGVRRYRELAQQAVKRGDGASLKPAERLLAHWYPRLVAAIGTLHARILAGEKVKNSVVFLPALQLLSGEKLAVITINQTLGMTMAHPEGVKTVKLTNAIGRAILAEIGFDQLSVHDRQARSTRRKRIKKQIEDGMEPELKKLYEGEDELLRKLGAKFKKITPQRINWWARRSLQNAGDHRLACVHLGAQLAYELLVTASADRYDRPFEPAFHEEMRNERKNRTVGYIVIQPKTQAIIEEGHSIRELLAPRHLPMVMEPAPWIDGDHKVDGGYLRLRVPLVSKMTMEQKRAIAAANKAVFYEHFQAVVKTKWSIEEWIAGIQRLMYEAGGGQLKKKSGRPLIPYADDRPAIPKPVGYNPRAPIGQRWQAVSPDRKKAYKAESAKNIKENMARRAERFTFLAKHAVADMFADSRGFYQPGRCCYRWRWYPVHSELHHQSDDVARGMLTLARAKKPGDAGERWLRIHAANTFGRGAEKLGLVKRAEWANEYASDIERSVADPMKCEFWQGAEKPFQFLAACRAIVDPNGAGARLPIFSDGTCNALQHYGALGRDPLGAAAVNMVDNEQPSDVYSQVAAAVKEIVADHARGGLREGVKVVQLRELQELATRLLPLINRDLVKQNVMTSVYGVTKLGARKQIEKKLKTAKLDDKELKYATRYLADVTYHAIGKVCIGARIIMDWFRECATIATEAGYTFQWTTKLGMPVIQPHRELKTQRVETVLQWITVAVDNSNGGLNKKKQRNAAAPNIIHSIGDSTHLYMTAKACRADDIDFIGRHDAYGCHAADGDLMAYHTRDQFVTLHGEPLMDGLHSEWQARYKLAFPPPPPRGAFSLPSVYRARHFFS